MIIDCHGHYTTAPAQLQDFRDAQLARGGPPRSGSRRSATTSCARASRANQLRILRERGGDLMIFSPKASGMEHHVPDPATAVAWARASNDLVARVAELYPENFAGVCQLPQTPGGSLGRRRRRAAPLRRGAAASWGPTSTPTRPAASGRHRR